MKWELHVPDRAKAGQPATVTVDAENWKVALLVGLKQLAEQQPTVARYTCEVREDGSLHIVDLGARRTFLLRDLETPPPPPRAPRSAASRPAPTAQSRASAVPAPAAARAAHVAPAASAARPAVSGPGYAPAPAPPAPEPSLPSHRLFFSRDEEPESGSSLWYRERLLAVPPGTTREMINLLLMSYYNQLRAEAAGRNEAKYINVAVFDHEFASRAERPALGALTWKSWRSEVPEVSYPVDQPAMPLPQVTAPPAPAPSAAPAQAAAARPGRAPSTPPPTPAQALRQTPPPGAVQAPRRTPPPPGTVQAPRRTPPPGTAQVPAKNPLSQTGRRRVPTPADLIRLGREGAEEMVVNEILAQVFEEMTGLFNCRTREAAAEFALDIAMRRIPCEAGSVLLSDINSRDLVFTAVRGEAGPRLRGRKVPMGKGIVGFAAHQGVAIAIADVRKDSRFTDDLDRETGFTTKSVIVAPIVHEGQTYGAFELLNRRGAEIFLQTETSIISYIASQLGEHLNSSVPSGGPDFFFDETKPAPARAPSPSRKTGATKKRAAVIGPTATVPAVAVPPKKR